MLQPAVTLPPPIVRAGGGSPPTGGAPPPSAPPLLAAAHGRAYQDYSNVSYGNNSADRPKSFAPEPAGRYPWDPDPLASVSAGLVGAAPTVAYSAAVAPHGGLCSVVRYPLDSKVGMEIIISAPGQPPATLATLDQYLRVPMGRGGVRAPLVDSGSAADIINTATVLAIREEACRLGRSPDDVERCLLRGSATLRTATGASGTHRCTVEGDVAWHTFGPGYSRLVPARLAEFADSPHAAIISVPTMIKLGTVMTFSTEGSHVSIANQSFCFTQPTGRPSQPCTSSPVVAFSS